MQLSPIQSVALFKYKDYTDFYKLIENTKILQKCCDLSKGGEISDEHVVSVLDFNIDDAIDEKFKSFGFNVINIDGHNMEQIIKALETAKTVKGKPTAIIAKTTKSPYTHGK